MKLIFYKQINRKVCQKFIPILWTSKFHTRLILSLLMDMIKHSQITQSNKFAISLQYLIKEVRNGGNFWHADKCQSLYKLLLSFLIGVARYVQNTPNRKLLIFLQYIKKKCFNCLSSILMQNIEIFYGDPVMFVFTWLFMICSACLLSKTFMIVLSEFVSPCEATGSFYVKFTPILFVKGCRCHIFSSFFCKSKRECL